MSHLKPVDRQLLDFLCSVEASRHCIVRSVKTTLRPSLRRLRYAGLVWFDSFTPSASAMADWRARKFPESPPSPGGAAGEEQPTPKAADAEGGAAARTVAAPPIAETFPKCGHPRTPENIRIVGQHRSAACRQCWRAALCAGQQRRQARKQEALERPFEVEPAHYEPADRQQRANARRGAAILRTTTRKARERIEQGLDPRSCKQASVRHAQFAIEAEMEQRERLADPVEIAKAKLQKRYTPVVCMSVYGGDADTFKVGRRTVTKAQLLEMAGRIAA